MLQGLDILKHAIKTSDSLSSMDKVVSASMVDVTIKIVESAKVRDD